MLVALGTNIHDANRLCFYFQDRQTRRIPSGYANTHRRVKHCFGIREKNAENFGESERHTPPNGNIHNIVPDYTYLAFCPFAAMAKICEVTVLYLKPGTALSTAENHEKYTTGIETLISQPGFRLLQEGRSMIEEELLVWLTGMKGKSLCHGPSRPSNVLFRLERPTRP